MKTAFIKACGTLGVLALSMAGTACTEIWGDMYRGEIRLSFEEGQYAATRAAAEVPDTNEFHLRVEDQKGKAIYDGKYGAAPETILASAGTYTVTVLSGDFTTPKFSAPQFGDSQKVTVAAGKASTVLLLCRQMNAGVRLKIAPNFLTSFPKGSLILKNADGKLLYSYSEKRIAYFRPGAVSLMLSDGGTDEVLLTRVLERQEVLNLNISAPAGPSASRILIQVDTNRNWVNENFVIGSGGDRGSDKGQAMSVPQAKEHIGEEDVWVYGYVVGGDLSSSKMSTQAPFSSRTNIVIAAKSSVTDKASCMSVQLQAGDIRDALNLVDNPGLLGKTVFLKGDIVAAYYGIPGIQNISEYELR